MELGPRNPPSRYLRGAISWERNASEEKGWKLLAGTEITRFVPRRRRQGAKLRKIMETVKSLLVISMLRISRGLYIFSILNEIREKRYYVFLYHSILCQQFLGILNITIFWKFFSFNKCINFFHGFWLFKIEYHINLYCTTYNKTFRTRNCKA